MNKYYKPLITIKLLIIICLLFSKDCLAQSANQLGAFQKPKAFVENKGQFDGRNWRNDLKINYGLSYNGFSMFFNNNGVTYRLDKFIRNRKDSKNDLETEREEKESGKPKWTNLSELINVSWIGSNKKTQIIPSKNTNYYFTYTYKKPGAKNYTNIDHANGYYKLLYKNLYKNIDVDYEVHPEKGIKYNITLHPGADISKVGLKYENYHTNTRSEYVKYFLDQSGNFKIQTSLDEITELKPYAYYKDSGKEIKITFRFENDILSFNLENYDKTKEVIIDPWVVNSTFNSSTAVWEVETDGAGNVYVIGGETPMTLDKYNSAGVLQWTHPTPWDTASVWLGTLATDNSGTSYITSGTAPEMQRVSNAGATNWTQTGPSGLGGDAEWWSITFNCDKTKLVVGGTTLEIFPSFNAFATIFNMDITSGNVLSTQYLAQTNLSGFGATPIEVRSISSSKNAKYIFLTHEDVGAINQNIGACPNNLPVFQVDNNHHLGYKCENYLPATQNGGGLKALVANDLYFYTHSGDKIRKRALSNGALLATATIPGGSNQTFMGDIVVHNSGLAVDNCGNIYAGSINNVIKFDADLNILSQTAVNFTVYDVSVNSNGEVIAVGAQSDNSANSRNGRIQALNLAACAQFVLICCDANICQPDTVCTTDAAFNLISSSPGGTWSGTGITNAATGQFTPSVAGAGSHTVYYTLACGTDSTVIVVNACANLNVCVETNGNLTVSNGTAPYTWQQWNPASTTPITNSSECTACGGSWTPFVNICMIGGVPATDCTAPAGWSTFATGTTVTPPGIWPIQVNDASSNTLTINSTAGLPSCSGCPALTITTSAVTGTCTGQSNGSFSVTTSGGASPYDYALVNAGGTTVATFSNIAGAQNFTGLATGTYTLNVTDNNACPGSTAITITTLASPTPTITGPTSICSGSTGTLNAGAGYSSYLWSTGATTQSITINAANTYNVTVTNASGCTGTATITVTLAANLTPTISGPTSICSGNTGTLDAGAGYTSYAWSTGATTQTITVNSANTYTVTVTNASGCTGTASQTVTIGSNLTPTITGPTSICSGNAVLDAGAGYTSYIWSTGATTQTITVSTANTYSVTVSNGAGCSGNASLTLSVAEPMNVYAHGTDPACGSTCNGTLTVDVTGGTPPYTYAWSGGMGSNPNVSSVCSGTYTVTITDASGCTSSSSSIPTACFEIHSILVDACETTEGYQEMVFFQVGPNALNTSTLNVTWPTAGNLWQGACTDPTFVANVNATITGGGQLVEPVGGVIPAGANVVLITSSGLLTQSFNSFTDLTGTLYVIFQCGSVNTAGHFANFGTGIRTLTMDFGGGCTDVVSYDRAQLVNQAGANVAADGAYVNFSNNGTASYENYGCVIPYSQYTTTVTISSSSSMTPTFTSSNPVCNGQTTGSANLTIAGGTTPLTYLWSTGATTQNISNLGAGTYQVTITDAALCSLIDSVVITEPAALTATITGTNIVCTTGNTGAASLSITGGTSPYTYAWSNGATTQNITGLSAGTYTVTVNDNSTGPASGNIVVNSDFNAGNTGFTSSYNYNSDLMPTGNYYIGPNSFAYNPGFCVYSDHTTGSGDFMCVNGSGTPNTSVWCQTLSINPNTTYNFSAWVSTLNPSSLAILQFEINGVMLGNSFTSPPTCDTWQQFQATWNSGANTTATICIINQNTVNTGNDFGLDDISFNAVGTNCTTTASVTITQSNSLTSSIVPTHVLCNGNLTGAANLTVTGGTAPFTYSWSNGATTEDLSNVAAGMYTVTATDANSCTSTATTTINQPAALTITPSSTNILCNGTNTGAVSLNITGGTAPYTYAWSNGSVSQSVSNLGAGAIAVTVTDANSCTGTSNATITQPTVLSGAISNQTNISCNGASNGSVTVSGSGGTTPYSYSWSDGQATATASNLGAGNYTVTITDANSCTVTLNVTITQQSSLSASIIGNNPLCAGTSTGSANLTVSGGTLPYTYLWTNGSTTQDVTNLAAGTYTVTVTDAQNCTTTANVTISSQTSITVTTNTTTNVSCNGGNNGSASINVSGGTQPYSYAWSANPMNNANSINTLSAGNNTVTVTDVNGCSVTHIIAISEPLALTLTTSSDAIICSGASTTLSANASGGTPAYSYYWNNVPGGSTTTVSPTTTTSYEVYVVDANGCSTGITKINVNVLPPLDVQVNCFINNICSGDSAQVFITATQGDGGPYTITNSNGLIVSSPLFVHPTQTQYYVFYATDGCNSTASDSVQINVFTAPPINIIADKISGCAPLLVHFNETSLNNGQSYVWDFGTNDENNLSLSKNPSHLFDVPGSYDITLTVTSAQGCKSELVVPNMIEVYPLPDARFSYLPLNASIVNPLITFTNYSTGNIGNYWFFGDGDSSVLVNPEHLYNNVGTFNVTLVAVSDKNCKDTAMAIMKINDIYTFYAPTAFSPDKDNKNDEFKVFASGIDVNNFQLIIFDRWGEVIFKSGNIEKGWDGKVDGKMSQLGSYAWIAIFKDFMGNQKTEAGKVTLIR